MANETVSEFADAFPGGQLGLRLTETLVVVILAWLLARVADGGLRRSVRRVAKLRNFDDYRTKVAVGRTKPVRLSINIGIVVLSIIAIVGIWGLNQAFTGLLAGAGFAGIVIGLAAGDVIGDIIAGFLLLSKGPFDIGDWVEIDGVQGIVEDVSLGDTVILTFDNEKVTIPNRLVEGSRVKNFSHARKLRFRVPVGVEYGTHLGRAMAILSEVGAKHPSVLEAPAPMAVSTGFGPSSVDLELRVWVEPIRHSVIQVRTDLVHLIHDRFREEGIKIAFPHMQIKQGEALQVDLS